MSIKAQNCYEESVNLSDGVAPAARLQNRACHFHGTRLLSNPILVMDTPSRGALRPVFLQLRPQSHPLAQPMAGSRARRNVLTILSTVVGVTSSLSAMSFRDSP